MDHHSRLADKLLHKIASARAGVAASYARLWRDGTVHTAPTRDGANDDDQHQNSATLTTRQLT